MSSDRLSKEARRPDAFLSISGQIIKALKPYSKQIMALSLLLAVVGLALAALNIQQANTEKHAQEIYVQAEKSYTKANEDFINGPEKIKSLQTQIDNIKKDKKAKKEDSEKKISDLEKQITTLKSKLGTGDFTKDYGKVVSDFNKIISEYPKTQAAILASIYLSHIYAENNKTTDAINTLSNPNLNYREGQLLYGLAQMKLGQLYESNGDCTKSISTWEKVLSYKQLSYFHPEASLATAVCYETLKKFDKAQEFYKKTHADFKNSSAGASAQKYMRLKAVNGKDS